MPVSNYTDKHRSGDLESYVAQPCPGAAPSGANFGVDSGGMYHAVCCENGSIGCATSTHWRWVRACLRVPLALAFMQGGSRGCAPWCTERRGLPHATVVARSSRGFTGYMCVTCKDLQIHNVLKILSDKSLSKSW